MIDKTSNWKACSKNDIKKATAEKIFDLIEKFAGYGFNKSGGLSCERICKLWVSGGGIIRQIHHGQGAWTLWRGGCTGLAATLPARQ